MFNQFIHFLVELDNIIDETKRCAKLSRLLPNRYKKDIDFLSSHFYILCENKRDQLSDLQYNTLTDILKNSYFKSDFDFLHN